MKDSTSSPSLISIDASGRLVIPKEICDEAGLRPGEPVQVSCRDEKVVIERMEASVRVEMRGRVAVAVAAEPVPTLTAAEVEQTRGEVLRRLGSE